MPGQRSSSGTKFKSFKVGSPKRRDAEQSIETDLRFLSRESGIAEEILNNVLKEFGREDLSKVYEDFRNNGTILNDTYIMAFVNLKKTPSFLSKMITEESNEFQSIILPKEFGQENITELETLQAKFNNSNYIYFPNRGLYSLDYIKDALNIFYNSGIMKLEFLVGTQKEEKMKISKETFEKSIEEYKKEGWETLGEENGDIIIVKKLRFGYPLPLGIKGGDYIIYIAPNVESKEEEPYEPPKRSFIPAKEFTDFLIQDISEIKERKKEITKFKKIWDHYSYKRYYRRIQNTINNTVFPNTIHDLQELKRNMEPILINELKRLLTEYSSDTNKLLTGKLSKYRRTDLKGLREVYEELVFSGKRKDTRRMEILDSVKNATSSIQSFLNIIDEKIVDTRSKLLNISSKTDERLGLIRWWYGQPFKEELSKKIPDHDWEDSDEFNIWISPTTENKKIIKTLMRDYYSIAQLNQVKEKKISEEKSRVRELLRDDENILMKVENQLRKLKGSWKRSSKEETVSRIQEQMNNLRDIRESIVESIRKKVQEQGYELKKGTSNTYEKALNVGMVEYTTYS